MSTDSTGAAIPDKATAKSWLETAGVWVTRGVVFLTWLAGVITWAAWMLGDRTEPAPPTPTPPPFITLDILPQHGEQPFLAGVGPVEDLRRDNDLMAGEVYDYHSRPGMTDMMVSVRDGGRVSRMRQVVFGAGAAVTLDGKDVDKPTLLAHIAAHRCKCKFRGGRFGPVEHAEFTTITE